MIIVHSISYKVLFVIILMAMKVMGLKISNVNLRMSWVGKEYIARGGNLTGTDLSIHAFQKI